MKRKVNLGVCPSRNFNKANVEILEEEIEFETEEEFQRKCFDIMGRLRTIADSQLEFMGMKK